MRTIHQSSISGCYPSLDYLLARRSYPRRASSLFTRRLGTGCPAPRVWAKSWSPPIPANRYPQLSPCPGPGEPAPWQRPGSRRTGTWVGHHPQQAGDGPRRSPGEPVNLLGPEVAPARKPAAIPSCSASAARCGRLEGPSRTTQAPHVPNPQIPLRSCRRRVGCPARRLEPTDCPLTGSAVRPNRCDAHFAGCKAPGQGVFSKSQGYPRTFPVHPQKRLRHPPFMHRFHTRCARWHTDRRPGLTGSADTG